MINVTIFSKDRAMQLELLLRSLKTFFKEWKDCDTNIIYIHSNESFKNGYEKCMALHPDFNWLLQTGEKSFKDMTLDSIKEENPFSTFFCDDDFIKNEFSVLDPEFDQFVNNQQALFLCLRLAEHTDYCYPLASSMEIPSELQQGKNEWNWQMATKDFTYPFSLEGNIYETVVIKNLITQLNFSNPNNLEAAMSVNTKFAQNLPLAVCYKNSISTNICANRVQTEFPGNRVGNLISPEQLNEKFVGGEIIDLSPLSGIRNNAAHIEFPYSFIKG